MSSWLSFQLDEIGNTCMMPLQLFCRKELDYNALEQLLFKPKTSSIMIEEIDCFATTIQVTKTNHVCSESYFCFF